MGSLGVSGWQSALGIEPPGAEKLPIGVFPAQVVAAGIEPAGFEFEPYYGPRFFVVLERPQAEHFAASHPPIRPAIRRRLMIQYLVGLGVVTEDQPKVFGRVGIALGLFLIIL